MTEYAGTLPALSVDGLRKTYGKSASPVLDIPDVEIRQGEFVVLLGPSGCGKTTFLRSVAGLLTPEAGRLRAEGKLWLDAARKVSVPPEHRGVGMVFQNYALWPHMSATENIAFPLRGSTVPKSRWRARVDELLSAVRCADLGDRFPAQLSGGQQQRIALARALVRHPRLVLFDEPLSNIDAQLRGELRRDIRQLHRDSGVTAIFVTHDQFEALQLATRIVILREGRIAQDGSPDEVFRSPASPYVAEFFGMTNHLPLADLGSSAIETLTGDGGRAVEPTDVLYFRPEDLLMGPFDIMDGHGGASTRVRLGGAVVVDTSFAGNRVEYVFKLAGQTFVGYGSGRDQRPGIGDEVHLAVDRSGVVCYRGEQPHQLPTARGRCDELLHHRRGQPPNGAPGRVEQPGTAALRRPDAEGRP